MHLIEKSLVANWNSHTARHLKVLILRLSGRVADSLAWIESSLKIDPFNYGCLFEQYQIFKDQDPANAQKTLQQLHTLTRNWEHNFTEYAFDYAAAGAYETAIDLLEIFIGSGAPVSPLVFYYLGAFSEQSVSQKRLCTISSGRQRPVLIIVSLIE